MARADDAQGRIAALQQLLRDAAQDGFAGLERAAGEIGSRLRVAADRVVAAWSGGAGAGQSALVAWRAELTEFEALERDTQVVVVARGQRLCFSLGAGGGERPAESPLGAPAESLPGIGPTTATRLGERGLDTVEDLIWFVPRRYDDARRVEPLAAALAAPDADEPRALSAEVAAVRFVRNGRRRWVEVRLDRRARGPGDRALVPRPRRP